MRCGRGRSWDGSRRFRSNAWFAKWSKPTLIGFVVRRGSVMAVAKIQPVILCGGAGTRLWPLSRHMFPKQLHALTGERSLLQETALRVSDADRFTAPIVVCNEVHG